jgi:gas vesicle protein
MAMTKDRVMYAADSAKPYLNRALTDEEFRDNLRAAFAAARAIYDELSRQRGMSSLAASVATDEDIHGNLRRAVKELRQAADRIAAREEQQSHAFRNVALVVGGILIGIFFNPYTGRDTRTWVKAKVKKSSDAVQDASPNGASDPLAGA